MLVSPRVVILLAALAIPSEVLPQSGFPSNLVTLAPEPQCLSRHSVVCSGHQVASDNGAGYRMIQSQDTTRITSAQRTAVWVMAGAGSVAGLIGGARAGYQLCGGLYHCSGEDPGLEAAIVGGLVGSVLGSAVGAMIGGSFAGIEVPFGRALSGAGPGAFGGLALGLAVARFVDPDDGPYWLIAWGVGQGWRGLPGGLPQHNISKHRKRKKA